MRARIHALSGAYALEVALEVVDDVERARFKAHMAHCYQCRDQVASLRTAATEMTWMTLAAPPAAARFGTARHQLGSSAVTPEPAASPPVNFHPALTSPFSQVLRHCTDTGNGAHSQRQRLSL